jgi:Rrf2 family protein
MNGNVRFAVAVHVLVLLALAEEPLSSASIAENVNTHAVVIRRILGLLQRAGLVVGRSGPGGGFRLGRTPESITLDQVFHAVDESGAVPLTHRPNPKCPVGAHVSSVLCTVGRRAEKAFLETLGGQTLAATVNQVRRKAGAAHRT